MSLPSKKTRDLTQLPTLSYEIKLNLPTNVDSNPQVISFLDLITNDNKFKNDKECLELVLSSYVKACGKQSVKEILAERDVQTTVDENASLSDVIHALMDYNDHQNANLGVGYNDPDDDDSFIDDSTAAQDIIPRNMTNERDGFYVNEKHQPIQAKYLSDSSDSDSDEEGEEDESSDDNDSTDSEKEDKTNKNDTNEKSAKKSKIDDSDDLIPKLPTVKRKRSISEVTAPALPVSLENKNSNEEVVKKVKKLSETCTQNVMSYILPNEMENDIKLLIEKLVKFIVSDQTMNNNQKKVARLFESTVCRDLLDLLKKLHRHTNANRQLVFDILSSKIGICSPILIARSRSVLLNDYEPTTKLIPLNDIKEKLKTEINRSLEFHIQAHNQAIKEWQQKMAENPSKDKNRGPRKNFRLYKAINELIIRVIDRKLETLTMCDSESLESFLQEHIVPLWEKPGWMTAKKIITEVIRIEYRPLKDPNQPVQAPRVTPTPPPVPDRVKKESQTVLSMPPPPSLPSPSLPKMTTPNPLLPKVPQQQQQTSKSNDHKHSASPSSNSNQGKSLEMATRVITTPLKSHTPRPISTESTTNQLSEQSLNKMPKSDMIRPVAKPVTVSPSSLSDSSTKRNSMPNPPTVVDLTMDLLSQYKKQSLESSNTSSRMNSSHSSSNKDLSITQRPTSSTTTPSTHNSKQQQQQQQQQQFATKLPSEKSPAGSFLKEALIGSQTSKISASPYAVDNMISKTASSPKPNINTPNIKPSSTTTTTTTTTTVIQSPTNNTQRSLGSQHKTSTNRPSTDFSHHRTDQPVIQQQQKTSSSSNRPSASSPSSSSTVSPAARRSATGFTPTHEQQTNRGHSSQVSLPPPPPPSLSQSLPWDSATLQLAAAAFANPQLLNSSVFDPSLLHSVFANMTSPNQSSSSRQQHSQNMNNNNRRS